MSPRRLLLVTTVPSTLSHFLTPYARHFRDRGWEVDAATGWGEDGPVPLDEVVDRVWRISWDRRLMRTSTWSRAPRELRLVLLTGRYDVVHTHTPIASFVTRLVVARLRAPLRPRVCYTAHGFHFTDHGRLGTNLAFRTAERLAGRWTDRLLVLSDVDLRAARMHRLVPAERLRLMPGVGIDLDHYRPSEEALSRAAALREDLGVRLGRPVFACVAELVAGKGHETVVRALAADPDLDAVLICLGSGPQRQSIAAEATRLGVQDRVRFLGSVEDVRPAVLAADATVLASYREGLSRAVMESLALGIPVVGSRIRGIAELVQEGRSGFLAAPGDVTGFARALREVLALPGPVELRRRLEADLARYGLANVLALHEQLYDELLAENATSAR